MSEGEGKLDSCFCPCCGTTKKSQRSLRGQAYCNLDLSKSVERQKQKGLQNYSEHSYDALILLALE